MIYAQLFYEFFKIGLFNFGGGTTAIPFLQDMSVRTGWFTLAQLTDFIAISESTQGPMAINMATYVGFETAGVLGSLCASLGVIFPALFIVTLMAKFLNKFRSNKYVEWAFYGLRPCVLALIATALYSIIQVTLFYDGSSLSAMAGSVNFVAWFIFLLVFVLLQIKPIKKIHPVAFLALSAILGILLYK